MTEKRYYILDSPHTMPFICDRLNNDKPIAEVHSDNVNQLCDLLNEQDERIRELEKENERLRMNQKSSIFNEDYRNYDNKGYTGKTIEDIRFRERTEQAFERVEKADSKRMTVDEFEKELEKW